MLGYISKLWRKNVKKKKMRRERKIERVQIQTKKRVKAEKKENRGGIEE